MTHFNREYRALRIEARARKIRLAFSPVDSWLWIDATHVGEGEQIHSRLDVLRDALGARALPQVTRRAFRRIWRLDDLMFVR